MRNQNPVIKSRFLGCLLGLAAGDALGAPVEFLSSLESIKKRYGPDGIQGMEPWRIGSGMEFPAGSYTDDTQMSLATAEGLIEALSSMKKGGAVNPAASVFKAYLTWLRSQDEEEHRRSPGNTCLGSLRSGKMGTIEEPLNDSQGCGGVMRTAPAGLVFTGRRAFEEGAKYAAITHGHPSGYLSAGFLAEVISRLREGGELKSAVQEAKATLRTYRGWSETGEMVDMAVDLARTASSPAETIPRIGRGWVGQEALAIALYCALKSADDFRSGVLAAVNHGGDSDSTGSITGAILGTSLGLEAIPAEWVGVLENRDRIRSRAEKLFLLPERA